MKKLKISLFLFSLFFLIPAAVLLAETGNPGPPPGSVLALAKKNKDASYKEALQKGAVIEPTAGETSFTVWFQQQNFDPKTGITLVSLHGHGGWATRDFVVWQEIIKKRGYAFLGIQWWYGRSMESFGYAKPKEIYEWIEESLKRHQIPPGRVILQGYSMGSANSYGVSLFDLVSNNHYFAVNIANSGPMESDFPLYTRIFNGEFGEKPFQDTRWILYCSEKDRSLKNACPGMENTEKWLTGFGAKVDWFYKDPENGHGGFMRGKIYDPALDKAEIILEESFRK